MLAKIRGAHRMVTADDELAFVRPDVVRAIEILRGRGLSQMGAYENLAGQVGKSPSWVRGIVGRDPSIGVRLRDALNLRAAYERLCARVEAAADASEAKNQALREKLDAALSGAAAPLPQHRGGAPVARTAAQRGEPRRASARALARSSLGPAAQPPSVNDLPLFQAAQQGE